MSKYWRIYTMSAARAITYRLNFVLGRLQNLMWLLVFYFIWTSLSRQTGSFAGLTEAELITYVFMVHLLRPFIFGTQMTIIADEISGGIFASYLTKPLDYFWLNYARDLGEKTVLTLAAAAEISIAQLFVPFQFMAHLSHPAYLILFILAALGAHFLYALMGYCLGLIAFWSNDAVGPRFLFNWIVEFTSGSFYPLRIVTGFFSRVLSWLPFSYVMYVPILIFLKKLTLPGSLSALINQLLWIAAMVILTIFFWRRGLRQYCGDGA